MGVQSTYSTGFTVAIEGQLADSGPHDIMAMRNDESSSEIPFGRAVKFNSTTDPTSAKLPTTETDKIAGIVVFTNQYGSEDLGTTGILPGKIMNVLRKGRIRVKLEDAVVVGDRGWVRAVAGAGELIGGILPADDSTDTIDCTNQIVFLQSGSTDDIVVAEVDFTNRPT